MLILFFIFSLVLMPHADAFEDEELRLRRIEQFWQDKEFQYVKKEIDSFFISFPKSQYSDYLFSILGDLAVIEKQYDDALRFYEQLSSFQAKQKCAIKQWFAMHQLKRFHQLHDELAFFSHQFLEDENLDGCFYFAESCFRLGMIAQDPNRAKELLAEAIPYYQSVKECDQYGYHACIALAEIYRLLNENKLAASHYLDAARGNEEWLYWAALMLMKDDPLQAESLFQKVAYGESGKRAEGAFQWLQMLAVSKKWSIIKDEKDFFLANLSASDLPACHHYLGMIAYNEKNYSNAAFHLEKSMQGCFIDEPGVNALAKSAYELGNLSILTQCATCYEKITARKSKEIALFQARLCRHEKKYREACAFLAPFAGQVDAELERALCLVEQGKCAECHAILGPLIIDHPELDLIRLDLYALVTLNDLHSISQLLEETLHLFSESEREEKKLILAKVYYQCNCSNRAIAYLEDISKKSSEHHQLLALCYLKEEQLQKAVLHGEIALKDPALSESDKLHLYMFNSYLQLSKIRNNHDDISQAAYHLDQIIDTYPISLENHLWLARDYAKKSDKQERAIQLLETLVQTEENLLRFQDEALLLLSLYAKTGRHEDRKVVLEKLMIKNQPFFLDRIHLQLADLYKDEGNIQSALEIYKKLEESSDDCVVHAAKLAVARIHYALGIDIEGVFHRLHDLKTRRNLNSEPIHLEAALDFAEFKSSLAPKHSREKVLLDFLLQIKEEFLQEDNIWAKDYHAARLQLPEKEELFQAYMHYLDLNIQNLQAFISGDKTKLEKAHESLIALGKENKTKYLMDKTAYWINATQELKKKGK